MKPNGMQGGWTWPARTSPVPAAILAALPPDGSTITRADLLADVRQACPVSDVTISVHLHEMANSPLVGVARVGYGLYQADPAAAHGQDQP